MGSLEAQFMQQNQSYNPLIFSTTQSQEFSPEFHQNFVETSTSGYRSPYCDRNPALGFSQGYNPFASAPAPVPHPPARYNPLSQSLPPFPVVSDRPATSGPGWTNGYSNPDPRTLHEFPGYSCYERPTTVHGYTSYPEAPGTSTPRGYNPFCQEFDPPPPGIVPAHEQLENSLVPYNFLPIRARTPPNIRQYAHHPPPQFPVHFPVHEELLEPAPAPTPRDAVVPFDSSTQKSQRLLWLSEEEAEIIRLIRLSQMKENLRSSGFSVSEDQEQQQHEVLPDISPNLGADLRASAQTNEKSSPGKSSNVSSTISADELLSPAPPEPQVQSKASAKKELPESKEPEPSPEKATTGLDSAKIVDDDREWISIQRQKIKDIQARKQQNAALCIQRLWREHLKRIKAVKKKQAPARVPAKVKVINAPEKSSSQENNNNNRQQRLQEAAAKIQRAWRAGIERKKLEKKNRLPKTLKGLYESIKFRNSSMGLTPPSYVKFLKLLDRIHACTEGARVRKRLKTRRLQAIVKEIKEIRMLLEDMSNDTAPAPGELLSQLSGQLQQKTVQLHTALQGPGDTARNLLRRGPATPLVLYGSKSGSSSSSQRTGDQVQIRVIGNTHTENGVPSVRCSLFTVKNPGAAPSKEEDLVDSGKTQSQKPETRSLSLSHDEKPLKRHQELKTKAENNNPESRSVKGGLENQRSGKSSQYFFIDKELDTQMPSRNDTAVASRLSQYLVNSRYNNNREPEDYENTRRTLESITSDSEQQSDHEKPKRPFLRRKSIAMAPQKLDWSKVKPMVSSRLEPELKTKLHRTKVKDFSRNVSLKKMNYSNVKSRLFSYESQGVESSGALNSDPSLSIEGEFEAHGRHGYAEIHTQPEMLYKEDCWTSSDPGTHSPDEPLPNYRYAEARPESVTGEEEVELEEEAPPTPKPPPKRHSKRFERNRKNYAAPAQAQGSGSKVNGRVMKSYAAAAQAQVEENERNMKAQASVPEENERNKKSSAASQAQTSASEENKGKMKSFAAAPASAPEENEKNEGNRSFAAQAQVSAPEENKKSFAAAPNSASEENERSRKSFAAQAQASALEEIDHNGELERKKQSQHSFRYKDKSEAPALEASVSAREPAVKETTMKRDRSGERKEGAEVHSGRRKDEDLRKNEIVEASPELEATFKHVMSIKNECSINVSNLFGAPQQQAKSIIPRLLPDASIFASSFSEKRRLHELLIKEGRASKLQPDSLAFVSIRD